MRALPVPSRLAVVRLARTALVLQVLLVATGAAVRLTGSGLGCPTWPRCTGGSLANTPALGGHGYVEFGNRLLAVAMELVGVGLVLAVRRYPDAPRAWRRLAWVQVAVVPLQAVVGGVLVLTRLNPYVLIGHFLLSFPLIAGAAALVQRVEEGGAPRRRVVRPELRWLTGGLGVTAALVLVAGTLVTGTGPHAGSRDVRRLPFDPREVTQLHADLVFLLVGLTVATAVAARALGAPAGVRRPVGQLVGLLVAQAALGYLQYWTGVPPLLVGVHVLGAAVIFTWCLRAHLATTAAPPAPQPEPLAQPELLPQPEPRAQSEPQPQLEPLPQPAAARRPARAAGTATAR